jgi:hypothetical protein
MRIVGDGLHGRRLRGLIVVLWRPVFASTKRSRCARLTSIAAAAQSDLGRPSVPPHRPLSAHRRPRTSRRLREGRDERVTLRAVDITAFGGDSATHQRVMVVKDPGPRRTERAPASSNLLCR